MNVVRADPGGNGRGTRFHAALSRCHPEAARRECRRVSAAARASAPEGGNAMRRFASARNQIPNRSVERFAYI